MRCGVEVTGKDPRGGELWMVTQLGKGYGEARTRGYERGR